MFKHILNDEEGSRVNVAFSLNICVVYFSVRDILPTFHEKKEGWEVKLFCWFSQLYRDLKSENWYVRWGKYCDSSEMHALDTYQHQRQPSIEYGRRAKRGGGEGGIFRIFLSLTLNSLHPPQAWSPLGFIQKLRIPKYNWSHRRIENSNLCFYIQNLLNSVGLNKLVRAKVKEALPRKNNEFSFHSLLFRVFVN